MIRSDEDTGKYALGQKKEGMAGSGRPRMPALHQLRAWRPSAPQGRMNQDPDFNPVSCPDITRCPNLGRNTTPAALYCPRAGLAEKTD